MDGISLPFTRQVNQFFGSETSPVPFFAILFVVKSTAEYRFMALVKPLFAIVIRVNSPVARGHSLPTGSPPVQGARFSVKTTPR